MHTIYISDMAAQCATKQLIMNVTKLVILTPKNTTKQECTG